MRHLDAEPWSDDRARLAGPAALLERCRLLEHMLRRAEERAASSEVRCHILRVALREREGELAAANMELAIMRQVLV